MFYDTRSDAPHTRRGDRRARKRGVAQRVPPPWCDDPVPHVSTVVARPWREVYAYAADPAHLPDWAAGLSSSALVPGDDGWWTASSPMGTVGVRFCERNAFGVLDHVVRLPDGTEVLNPMRVIPWDDAAEVVFSIRRRVGATESDVEADAAAVAADLVTLKRILESGPPAP